MKSGLKLIRILFINIFTHFTVPEELRQWVREVEWFPADYFERLLRTRLHIKVYTTINISHIYCAGNLKRGHISVVICNRLPHRHRCSGFLYTLTCFMVISFLTELISSDLGVMGHCSVFFVLSSYRIQ